MMSPGKAYGFIKNGLHRNHDVLHGGSVMPLDSVSLGKQRPG